VCSLDRVHHDTLMSLVKQRVADRRVRQRIDRSLKAGALTDEGLEATVEGPPQGGPWSPLLANLRLEELDKELERRGHRFVRDADASHIYVQSARAGQRVWASVTRFLARRVKLAVKAAKSTVDRPWQRTFLGLTCTGHRPNRRRVRAKALQACKHEVRRLISRTRGMALERVVGELRQYLERSWTPGSAAGCAATYGSRGVGASTGNGAGVGSAGIWPGIRSNPPTGRGVGAAARRWRSPSLAAPSMAGVCRGSTSPLPADSIHRTAGYVTRMSGGVGGGRP
jgi:Reverse transcriptase (RNA-dependent DNA polymerase)